MRPYLRVWAFRMAALRRRAIADGVEEAAVEEAEDSSNPKEAIIDLIVDFKMMGSGHGSS